MGLPSRSPRGFVARSRRSSSRVCRSRSHARGASRRRAPAAAVRDPAARRRMGSRPVAGAVVAAVRRARRPLRRRPPRRRPRRRRRAPRCAPRTRARSRSPATSPARCTSSSRTPAGCARRTRSSPTVAVRPGQRVARGARGRHAGRQRREHAAGVLHFGLRVGERYVDPMLLFRPRDLTALVRLVPADPSPGAPWTSSSAGPGSTPTSASRSPPRADLGARYRDRSRPGWRRRLGWLRRRRPARRRRRRRRLRRHRLDRRTRPSTRSTRVSSCCARPAESAEQLRRGSKAAALAAREVRVAADHVRDALLRRPWARPDSTSSRSVSASASGPSTSARARAGSRRHGRLGPPPDGGRRDRQLDTSDRRAAASGSTRRRSGTTTDEVRWFSYAADGRAAYDAGRHLRRPRRCGRARSRDQLRALRARAPRPRGRPDRALAGRGRRRRVPRTRLRRRPIRRSRRSAPS